MFEWLFGSKKENEIKLLDNSFFDIKEEKGKREIKLLDNNVLNIDKVIIVKFGTSSCPACLMFRDPLKYFENQNKNNIETYEVLLDEEPELSEKLNIRSVPTNFIFVNGELFDISIGASLEDIVLKLKPLNIEIK